MKTSQVSNNKKNVVVLTNNGQIGDDKKGSSIKPSQKFDKAEAPKLQKTPKVKALTVETPVAVIPQAQAPIAETPVAVIPQVQAPVAEIPVAVIPQVQAPVAETPVAVIPQVQAPVAEIPVAVIPQVQAPVAEIPVAVIPQVQAPVAEIPVAVIPQVQAPTPQVTMVRNLGSTIELLKELQILTIKRERLLATINKLTDFKVDLNANMDETSTSEYSNTTLTIKDDDGNKFTTRTPEIIKSVADHIMNMCTERLGEVEAGIVIPA